MAQPKVPRIQARFVGAEKVYDDLSRVTNLLGEVALEWAQIEHSLCQVVETILGIDQKAAEVVFYTPSSFSARIDILINLARHYVPACQQRDDLAIILDKLRSLNGARNNMIHSMYMVNIDSRKEAGGYISRRMTHPRRKQLYSDVPNPISAFSAHLDGLFCCHQYLFHLQGNFGPFTAQSARHWLSMARNI